MKEVWWGAAIAALIIYKRNTIVGLAMDTNVALQNKNVQAFLATIRHTESGGDYRILYGGSHFSDFATHPDQKIYFFNEATQKEDFSTAAGAYQINHPTWLLWRVLPGTPQDFSPATQDYLAVNGLKLIGALPDIIAGNFAAAIDIASGTWASLPGSRAKQHPVSFALVEGVYTDHGGIIA